MLALFERIDLRFLHVNPFKRQLIFSSLKCIIMPHRKFIDGLIMIHSSYIEMLEKKVGSTPELIALKQKRDQKLAEIQPIYEQTQREQEELRIITKAAALDFQRKSLDERNQETCIALGLNYFSLNYSSPEQRAIHDEFQQKDKAFRSPVLLQMVHAPFLKSLIRQQYGDEPNSLLEARLRNECLPLISIDQAFDRIQEEALGFEWLPKIKVIDFMKDTDNDAVTLFFQQLDVRTIQNGTYIESIHNVDGFNQSAYISINKYNQELLRITGLDGFTIDSLRIDSAHVNQGLVPRQDVQYTRKLSAQYAEKIRAAEAVYRGAVDPLRESLLDIHHAYEVALKALIRQKATPITPSHGSQTEQKKQTTSAYSGLKSTIPTDFDVFQYCIDYDGCTDTPGAQRVLIQYIVSRALDSTQCTMIQLSIASRRQSLYIDFVNAKNYYHENGHTLRSAATMLDTVTRLLSAAITASYQEHRPGMLPPQIEINPLLTFDVFNQLKPGTSYLWMRQESNYALLNFSEKPVHLLIDNEINEQVCLFSWMKPEWLHYPKERSIICDDRFKTLTHYMFAHDVSLKFPGKKIALVFIDNCIPLLNHAANLFKSHSQAFPADCYFQGIQLDSATQTMGSFKTAVIEGEGEANTQWQSDLRHIARQYPTQSGDASESLLSELLHLKATSQTCFPLGHTPRREPLFNPAKRATASPSTELRSTTGANIPSITFFAPWLINTKDDVFWPIESQLNPIGRR